MARPRHEKFTSAEIQSWELDLIRKVASRFRTSDAEELEAELARLVLEFKMQSASSIRNWKSYLAKLLYNKASNWVRDARLRETHNTSLDASIERTEGEIPVIERFLGGLPEKHDLRISFMAVWNQLDPQLRRFWEVLLEEQGNQLAAAKRLGKHRNTVRLWIRKIQTILKQHDFPADPFQH